MLCFFVPFCILQCVGPLGTYPQLNGWWQLTDTIPAIRGLLVLSILRLSCLRYGDPTTVAQWRGGVQDPVTRKEKLRCSQLSL
jgi:hypothetical protein